MMDDGLAYVVRAADEVEGSEEEADSEDDADLEDQEQNFRRQYCDEQQRGARESYRHDALLEEETLTAAREGSGYLTHDDDDDEMEVSSADEEEGYGRDVVEWRQRRDERVRREQAQVQQMRLEIAMQNKIDGVATAEDEELLCTEERRQQRQQQWQHHRQQQQEEQQPRQRKKNRKQPKNRKQGDHSHRH